MITHVKFVSLPTADQDRALAFYTEKLGFKVVTDQPFGQQRWIELRIGASDTRLVLFTMDKGPRPGDPFNAAFACDNVERTYDELVAKGVTFKAPPKKEPWGTFAILTDPDGNEIVLGSK
jgi:catechol 2,3-dioxygenase-like lactoylglutathione lyase family enzyme